MQAVQLADRALRRQVRASHENAQAQCASAESRCESIRTVATDPALCRLIPSCSVLETPSLHHAQGCHTRWISDTGATRPCCLGHGLYGACSKTLLSVHEPCWLQSQQTLCCTLPHRLTFCHDIAVKICCSWKHMYAEAQISADCVHRPSMRATKIDEQIRTSRSSCQFDSCLAVICSATLRHLAVAPHKRPPLCRTPKQAEGLRDFQAYASRAALTEHIQRMPAQPAQARANVAQQECAFLAAAGQVPAAGVDMLSRFLLHAQVSGKTEASAMAQFLNPLCVRRSLRKRPHTDPSAAMSAAEGTMMALLPVNPLYRI